MDNDLYAIRSILQKMKDDKRNRFFSFTNLLLVLQLEHSFTLLEASEEIVDQLQNYSQIVKEDYEELSHIYGEYVVFNKLKNLTTKYTFVKKVNPTFDDLIADDGAKEEFKKLCNAVALVNLLQKRLKGKTLEELTGYKLLEKLTSINRQLPTYLGIQSLTSVTTDEQLASFAKEEYTTYDDINMSKLNELIETDGQRIYNLIDLFQ